MKTIYTAVMNQLKSEVPALEWIELNIGQLESIENGTTMPITYPCALIDISLYDCKDVTNIVQDCKCKIDMTLVFDPIQVGKSAANSDEEDREAALFPYDVITKVYSALQGFENENLNSLSRISQGRESNDKLFVYRISFNCDFEDLTAEKH